MKFFKQIFLVIAITFCFNANAQLECSTPNDAKIIKVYKTTISFSKGHDNGRELASTLSTRTQKTVNGFTKFTNFEGLKYELHVENVNIPSEVNDYLVIKNRNGHQMTYPVNCITLR